MATDQSTLANYKSSDFQAAKASGTAFTMGHKMGLAQIALNSTTIYDSYTYTYMSTTNPGTPAQSGGNTWYASSTHSGSNLPYRASNTEACYLRKPGAAAVTLTATQSNVFNTYKSTKRFAWSATAPVVSTGGTYVSVAVSYSGPPYLQATWNIPCLSGIVAYTTPYAGKYEFKCWGANGGNGFSTYFFTGSEYREATSAEKTNGSCYSYGGKGGYTYGVLSSLAKNITFFVCVGGAGSNSSTAHLEIYGPLVVAQRAVSGGYNGGGNGSERNNGNVYVHNGAGGGGATHIATATGLLQSLTKAQTLMVAGAGAGGGGHQQGETGGYAGGTSGYPGSVAGSYAMNLGIAQGGSQSQGGGWKNASGASTDYSSSTEAGSYGKGGSNKNNGAGGGGGAGYYGGAGGYWNSGGGGSSYINGHSGCTQQNPTYVFTGTSMIAGANVASQAPNPSGNNNGYARIAYTYIP